MRYAIHRGLDVQTVAEILGSDHKTLIKNLIKNIDLLSKYTHISGNTFPTNTCDNNLALTLFENLAEFLNNIIDAERCIANYLEKEIGQVLEDGFFNEYFDEIDHLATHHGIEEVYVNSILVEQFDSKNLTFSVEGTLEFSLQWGSNSDMRKGDGATGEVGVDFSAIVKADIEDIMRLEVISYSLDEDKELKVKFYDEE